LAIDVADLLLDGGEPGGSGSGLPATYTVQLGRSDGYSVVTDVRNEGLFAGFRDAKPFVATVFEDLNSDLRVSAPDISILLSAFGAPASSSATEWDSRDLDRSGTIDAADFTQLLLAYSGSGLAVLPDICRCQREMIEPLMELSVALQLHGFEGMDRFRSWFSEEYPRSPDLVEWQIASIAQLLKEGRP
jgi:hypothetical protein